MNVILSNSHERIFSRDEPVVVNQLGLYIIRGENVYGFSIGLFFDRRRAVVGQIEEELDGQIEYEALMAEPLPHIVH